jgi:ribosomal protein S18 acetylase RimI-like enzyme
MTHQLEIRQGGLADVPLLLEWFDEAVAWLVARGQVGQWGAEPLSQRPQSVAWVEGMASGGGLRIAELDGQPAGALIVGDAPPPHVPAIDRPELYIQLLLTSRRQAGRRIGTRLVEEAIAIARSRGVGMVRVDCWAEAPTLVAWYRRHGFEPAGTFEVGGWRGQIFEMPLGDAEAPGATKQAPSGSEEAP